MTAEIKTRIDSTISVRKADGSVTEHVVDTGHLPEVVEFTGDDIRKIEGQSKVVGYCIYCNATVHLSREHIVPFGLSGTAVLQSASCETCRKATSAFEAAVLRGPMRDVRVLRRLRSRSKHSGASLTGRLQVVRNGVAETVALPLERFPILLHFPTFERAGYWSGRNVSGVNIVGVTAISFGSDPAATLRALSATSITITSPPEHPIAFARMIAKIGYSMAVADGKTTLLLEPAFVLPAIRGDADDIGQWVGMAAGPVRKYSNLLHRIGIIQDKDHGLLLAEVQLFADSAAPTYEVVLGKMKN